LVQSGANVSGTLHYTTLLDECYPNAVGRSYGSEIQEGTADGSRISYAAAATSPEGTGTVRFTGTYTANAMTGIVSLDAPITCEWNAERQ
jgi:hypothetical protein